VTAPEKVPHSFSDLSEGPREKGTHSFSDPGALPQLQTAVLDAATLGQLFVDLQACAQVLDVLAKRGAEVRADEAPITLADAHRLLVQGAARGIQLRYLYDGAEWRDTLLAAGGAFRLCRMKMPPAA
jgi:hypothetical protein